MLAEYVVSKAVQCSGRMFVKKVMERATVQLAVGIVVDVVRDVTRPLKPENKRNKRFA